MCTGAAVQCGTPCFLGQLASVFHHRPTHRWRLVDAILCGPWKFPVGALCVSDIGLIAVHASVHRIFNQYISMKINQEKWPEPQETKANGGKKGRLTRA